MLRRLSHSRSPPRRGDRLLSAESGMRSAELKAEEANGAGVPSIPNSEFRTPHSNAPTLLFEQVTKWYGPVIGVNHVSLELRTGITGLVGANGAGKSTLLRLATWQLKPNLGRVTVQGVDAWSLQAKRHVGYCPEVDAFYEEMSGRQFVESMARLCGYPRREARQRTE